MKRSTKLFGIAVLAAAMVFTAVSCDTGTSLNSAGNGGDDPTVTGVTVTPATATVPKGGSEQFSVSVAGTNDPAQTVTWSITTSGKHADTKIDGTGKLIVAADETQKTLTVRATSTVDTGKYGEAVVTVETPNQWTQDDIEDFGAGASITNVFDIDTTAKWNAALDAIAGGSKNVNYVMNITANIEVAGHTPQNYYDFTFGDRDNVIISIRGDHKVSLSTNGSVIDNIWSSQSVIMRDVDFVGRQNNTDAIMVGSGRLTLKGSASISGNDFAGEFGGTHGGGAFVGDGGILIMEDDARIFGNKAETGGGVFIAGGTLIMRNNASIGGNNAELTGGVYIDRGFFQISGGTVFGNNSGENSNKSLGEYGDSSAALYIWEDDPTATAQYGTFSSDGTFTSRGGLTTTNDTIKVVNGVLQR